MLKSLTDAFVDSLEPPASGRIEIGDARCIGLTLRVTKAGAKSWSFRFRQSGAVSRVTIGNYPTVGLGKARKAADAMRAKVQGGGDPAAEKREQRTGGRSFATLAARYLREHAERHKRPASAAADARNLRKHVLPRWKNRDYKTIRRGDVITLIEGIIATGKNTLANRIQALVSKVFSFAIDAGLRDDNPCARMKRRGVESVGHRVLSDAELRLFWAGIVIPPDVRRTGLALRLALLTGCRVGEVAGINRDELAGIEDPATAQWTIPGARTKNKRDHLIPLAPIARQTVLDLLALIESDEKFLLPTRSRSRSGAMRGNSLTQAMGFFADRLADRGGAGANTWTADRPSPHDLRRTLETRLAALGVPKEHRDHVLNHVQQDVGTRHYDRHSYRAEKLAALSRWEGALTAVLSDAPGTVVALSDRRAVS